MKFATEHRKRQDAKEEKLTLEQRRDRMGLIALEDQRDRAREARIEMELYGARDSIYSLGLEELF